jgi:hypothetical protein
LRPAGGSLDVSDRASDLVPDVDVPAVDLGPDAGVSSGAPAGSCAFNVVTVGVLAGVPWSGDSLSVSPSFPAAGALAADGWSGAVPDAAALAGGAADAPSEISDSAVALLVARSTETLRRGVGVEVGIPTVSGGADGGFGPESISGTINTINATSKVAPIKRSLT